MTIFLDIDGVLRTHKSDLEWSLQLGVPIPLSVYDRRFDRKIVSYINEVVGYTRAKIVITSTWRVKHSLEELKQIFRDNGINAEIVGKTDIGLNRGEEIEQYISENEIENYVVIDDQVNDILKHIPKERVIKVDPIKGFEDVEKAIDILL
jgi:diphthamide synthase subunit DPH2